jgi:hypothetical protein
VVTPSRIPQRAAVRISSMSAVSRKIFMAGLLRSVSASSYPPAAQQTFQDAR